MNQTESSENDSVIRNSILPQIDNIVKAIEHIRKHSSTSIFSKTTNGKLKLNDFQLWKLLLNFPYVEDIQRFNLESEYTGVYIKAHQKILEPIGFKAGYFKNWKGNDVLYPEGKDPILVGELANMMVSTMSSLINEEEFIVAQRNRQGRSKHQYSRAEQLVNMLKIRYAKILVLRLDFAIAKNSRNPTEDLNLMRDFLKKFLKMTYSMKERPIGYIWKLEYGAEKGYHYHTLIFLDGNQHKKDEILADKFGKAWLQVAQGKGAYFSVNAIKERYKNLAIGMLCHDDDKAFSTLLLKLVNYFVKNEQLVFVPFSHRLRAFGTSQMPASKRKSGRPRRGI